MVRDYGTAIGVLIGPHDLRRTFGKLAHKGNAALEQIQLSLGHASVITERYLGVRQNLNDAPCDHLGLDVDGDGASQQQRPAKIDKLTERQSR